MCVCTTLTHACEEWNLTKAVSRILNGFNSRCLHVITRLQWYRHFSSIKHVAGRTTATSPLPVTLATSPAWQCGAPNIYFPWRMETTGAAIRKGLYSWTARVQNWNTLRPWQWTALHGGTKWQHLCFTVTLHHWTHWVHYEHDDDDG